MKKMLTLFAVILAIGLGAPHAEAKKFGGSKSFGKSYKTAPAQPAAKPVDNKNPTLNAQTPPKKSGMMGGLLGGLLAGGLFAYLLGSGAFEGMQGMDFLLIALLALGAVFLFRALRKGKMAAPQQQQAAYAGYQAPQAATQQFEQSHSAPQATGFADSDVPFRLPPGFDMNGFLAGARDHYRTLQEAWNKNDLEKIREYVSPELFEQLKAERAELTGEQHTEVMYVDTQLVRADYGSDWAQVSVRFSGRYMDRQEQVEEDIKEVWHLERDLAKNNAPWHIVGIEQL
ncbi:Tim44 domain-containing protein [Aeromonas enteropelogenes]|uniref:Tim44 domain-containing protein n=1 Tax=Aeromonas enteropelogenes TaxID=29489 RepID=UPI00191CB397|nr:Tim44-like domain-containing protein [Aeromonas enteropelogenes]MBL0459391.1 Tim44 domain-containing protein [Aeromonas enteropelogenes]